MMVPPIVRAHDQHYPTLLLRIFVSDNPRRAMPLTDGTILSISQQVTEASRQPQACNH